MYKPTDYAYIVGRLRALDTRLLTPNLVERMIDAPTADDAFRILNDLTFLAGCIGDSTVNDFQIVLFKGVQKMLRLVKRMSPNPEVVDFLNFKFDFHNLKVSLKARLTQRGYADIKHALLDIGSLSEAQWEQFVLDGTLPRITASIHDTIQDVNAQYEKTQDPQIVDLLVDKHYLEASLELTKKLGSELMTSYTKRLIDFTNLKTLIRCKELEKSSDYLQAVLLGGGYLSADVFVENYSKTYEEIRVAIESKLHADDLVVAIEEFIKERTLIQTEKKVSELLEIFMQQARQISFGPEPIFAFFWKFENHIQVLRTILVSKLNHLPSEETRKYVLNV